MHMVNKYILIFCGFIIYTLFAQTHSVADDISYKETINSQFSIEADYVKGIEVFEKKPKVYLSYTVDDKEKKKAVKVLNPSSDFKDGTLTSINCTLSAKVEPGTYSLYLIPAVKGEKPGPKLITESFVVYGPVISTVTPNHGSAGDEIMVTGKYFGYQKSPAVWLSYANPKKTGKYIKKKCKVKTFSVDDGVSSLTFIVPQKIPDTECILILKTKIGETTTPFNGTAVTVNDSNLAAALKEKLGLEFGDRITQNGLASITSLSLDGSEVSDLTGLEFCTGLTWLNLANNQISDISPLTSSGSLEELYLSQNQISDISPLASFVNLKILDLSFNQIADLSALKNLTAIVRIDLSFNHFTEISTLIENSGLGSGDTVQLTGNLLSATALNTDIVNLQNNEVTVVNESVYYSASGFIGMETTSSISVPELTDSSVYSYSLYSGEAEMSVDSKGFFAYQIPASAEVKTYKEYIVKADNANTGASYYLKGSVYIIEGSADTVNAVDSAGGTVTDSTGTLSITIPSGAVSGTANISIFKGSDNEGNSVLAISSDQELNGNFTINLPDIEDYAKAAAKHKNNYQRKKDPSAQDYIITKEWTSYLSFWWDEGIIGTARFDRNPIYYDGKFKHMMLRAEKSALLKGSLVPYPSKGKIPILFVHGFTMGDNTFGGGEGTWGELPELLENEDYLAGKITTFEFRWRTNARFQDVAADLQRAIDLIAQKTNNNVHIIAHSFGGILVRTYLQGLARQDNDTQYDYTCPVASFISIGTPHSGIADEEDKIMHGISFPDGQDGDYLHNGGMQISMYQAGEYVKFPQELTGVFGTENTEGYIVALLNDIDSNPFKPYDFPVLCLIGITTDRGFDSVIDDGDCLITYNGQRFFPNLRSTTDVYDEANIGRIVLTEQIIGSDKGETVKPGDINNWEDYNKKGYRHNSAVGLGGARSSAVNEVLIEKADSDDHAVYQNIVKWIKQFLPFPTAHAIVIDVSAGAEATNYPFVELSEVPADLLTNDEYKTTKIVLVKIPSGIFYMGSPESEYGREKDETRHQVTLTEDYYMGVFEITKKQWLQVMGELPYAWSTEFGEDGNPISRVMWNYDLRSGSWPGDPPGTGEPNRNTFIGKLRAKTGLSIDLPTEAQWENACRAGTTSALNNGSNVTGWEACASLNDLAWYGDNSDSFHHIVGLKQPNNWGLYDMHGNVWELCLDHYDDFTGNEIDPIGPEHGNYVMKGGSWISDAVRCRSATRSDCGPLSPSAQVGFRIALKPSSGKLITIRKGWDNGRSDNWIPLANNDSITIKDTGGNPNGYLYSAGSSAVGARNGSLLYTKNFNEVYYKKIYIDIQFISGNFTDAYLLLYYKDGKSGFWGYPINSDFTLNEWNKYSVIFDTEWTDEEATAAGWENYKAPSFADTMSDLYTIEFSLEGDGALEAGLDNFILCSSYDD